MVGCLVSLLKSRCGSSSSWEDSVAAILILLLMPRMPKPTSTIVDETLTDASTILRIFLIIGASVFALVALVLVLLVHGMSIRKAPTLIENAPPENFRMAKVVEEPGEEERGGEEDDEEERSEPDD